MSWDEFTAWAARFAKSVDVDATERTHLLDCASLLAEARTLLLEGSPRWVEEFVRGLRKSGLHFIFVDNLRKAALTKPDELGAALLTVWDAEPASAALDGLGDVLASVMGRVTPGNTTALGSYLLFALNAGDNPPYAAEFVVTWSRRVGLPELGSAMPSERYQRLLDLCDGLLDAARGKGIALRDRLDARGVAYWVLKGRAPNDWPNEERVRLGRFRGDSVPDVTPEPRAWLVRPKPHGSRTLARWVEEGIVSLVAQYLGDVPAGADLPEVRDAVEKGYLHLDYAQRLALAEEYHAFLSRMNPDDLVTTVVDDRFHVGVITGEPEYAAEDAEARLRRSVDWIGARTPLANLAPPLPALLDQQGTVVDLTAAIGEVQRLADAGAVVGEDLAQRPEPSPPPRSTIPSLRPATDELAGSLHLSREWLQEMIDLLQSRQQIVFYGPPGTGKTYVARELARHLVGADDPSRSRLVQFHPSYAYEDFFEGFRPAEGGSFVLTPGPLRDLAAAALAAPGEPFVLIIDEMNRANLAKVFGELYFLLEYRDQAIRLQYRPTEAFRLPPNLFLIGTMNTADRSIALVDAAIRRRFAFVELHPDEAPVRDLLRNFLAANKKPAEPLVGLLRALNAQIEDADRDLRIGPTYLMRPDVARPGGLHRVWRYDLLPLLEEHYYGRLNREEIHRRFGLEALRGVVGEAADAAPTADDGAGPEGESGPIAPGPGTGGA